MALSRRDFLRLAALTGAGALATPVLTRLLGAAAGGPYSTPHIASGPYPSGRVTERLLTQVHCHTTSSDGSYSPATVVAGYLAAGYDVLAITDHDTVTSQPDGIATKITANEVSPSQQHIVSLNSTYTRGGGVTDPQTIIDGIRAAGGEAHIAHPDWDPGITYAEMAALTDYLGIEIHSGYTMSIGSDPTTNTGYAISQWDQLLTNVRRDVWGLSVDDLHVITSFMTYDVGRLHVFAASPSVAHVMAALAAGNFVADVSNHGVTPAYPRRSNAGVELACIGATRIEAWGESGLLQSSAGTSISHEWDGSSSYVRLVAVGDYTEPFDTLSDRWVALDGTWTADGDVSLASDATVRRLILRRQREGAFTAQVDVRINADGLDMAAFMFHVLDTNRYYMVRIGEASPGDYHNALSVGMTTTNNFSATPPLDFYSFTHTPGTWYTLKMDYTAAGRIRAKVWERGSSEPDWQVDVTDATWTHGAFGFRANRSAAFDNLYIDGFRTYYQPIAID